MTPAQARVLAARDAALPADLVPAGYPLRAAARTLADILNDLHDLASGRPSLPELRTLRARRVARRTDDLAAMGQCLLMQAGIYRVQGAAEHAAQYATSEDELAALRAAWAAVRPVVWTPSNNARKHDVAPATGEERP